MAKNSEPTPTHEAIDSFVELYNPLAVSRHLRLVFMTALKNDRFVEEGDFDEIVQHIEGLFDLMEEITDKAVYEKK